MEGTAVYNDGADLRHKPSYGSSSAASGVESITQANPSFDLKALLEATLAWEVQSEIDPLFSLSPLSSACPSPMSAPAKLQSDLGCDDAFSLSPLSSPEPSRPSSPAFEATAAFDINQLSCNDLPSLVPAYDSDSSAEEEPLPTSQSRIKARLKARLRARTHRKRTEKRRQEREANVSNFTVRPNMKVKHVDGAESIETDLKTEKASAAHAAFVGRNDRDGCREIFTLEQLVGESSDYGFKYIPWDGRETKRVTDDEGRVIAILAGQPQDPSWSTLAQQAADALESASEHISVSADEQDHRRGAFPALRCGVSHGGGSSEPSNLFNPEQNAKVLHNLSQLKPFQRLAGFASSVMATHAPKLYAYYVDSLGKLHAKHPHLRRLFPSSVFAAASYNFGPRTVCYKHKDFANLPFGLCAVTALGSFDPRKGGHLILWECHLVVEFPPGSTILLPSAIIAHSNTPIAAHEKRFSFAQYTAGGLFRWVEHGYRLSSKFYSSLTRKELDKERKKDQQRWKFGLSLFSKVEPSE